MSTLNDMKRTAVFCAHALIEQQLKELRISFEFKNYAYKVGNALSTVDRIEKYDLFSLNAFTANNFNLTHVRLGAKDTLTKDMNLKSGWNHYTDTRLKMYDVLKKLKAGNARKLGEYWLYKGSVYSITPIISSGKVQGTRIEHANFNA